MQIESKITEFGTKSKRKVDLIYVVLLSLFLGSYACALTRTFPGFVDNCFMVCSAGLSLIAIYRLILVYIADRKKVILPISIILFGFLICLLTGNNLILQVSIAALAGMNVSADYILGSGIAGNLLMIVNNIVMSIRAVPGIYTVDNQDRQFFLLGNNTFYLSKMNNFSSTDFAAHYFWMIAAYLWVRGKKITLGEIFALGALNILVYSLTASKTSLVCICLLLIIAMVMKVSSLITSDSGNGRPLSSTKTAGRKISDVFAFCCRYSFLIFAFACITLTVLFSCSSPSFLKLNDALHWRLSLGRRGITEYGIHLIRPDIPVYGMSSSYDGYYNFLDCSYVSVLLRSGILVLVFYLLSMTVIQLRHKKYIYGAAILAVCALSCIEEHHLSEMPYNMFILLLFSDIGVEKKLESGGFLKKPAKTAINAAALSLCAVFSVFSAVQFYPKYKAVKELDRLDGKAGEIYEAVQDNLDLLVNEGLWEQAVSSMSSYQYGEILKCPDDFTDVTGKSWKTATKDPKEHAFYSVSYSPGASDNISGSILELMTDDRVEELVGNGSIVIEYDVISGKVYSVWYSDMPGCHAIKDGRREDRAGRLRSDVTIAEGYSTGVNDA